jgi:hypothetical protein
VGFFCIEGAAWVPEPVMFVPHNPKDCRPNLERWQAASSFCKPYLCDCICEYFCRLDSELLDFLLPASLFSSCPIIITHALGRTDPTHYLDCRPGSRGWSGCIIQMGQI